MARLPSPRTLLPLSLLVIFLLALPLCLLAGDDQQVNAPSPVPDGSASAMDLEEQGDALRAQKRYLDSLDFYSTAIAKHPTALLWNKEGMAYLFLQKYAEATKCFDRAIKKDKKAPEGYNNRGYMEQRKQNYNAAIKYYQKALALHPNDAVFHYNMGSSYFGKHEYELAAQHYRAEERVFAGGGVVLGIGQAETGGPLVFSVFDDCDGESGDVGCRHVLGNGGFDLGALNLGELGLLS